MNSFYKRILLFSFLCIPTRFAFMYLSKVYSNMYSNYFIFLALVFSIMEFYIYLTDSRKTGAEVFGNDIWWNELRPIHAILYLLFCIYTYKKNHYAYIPLLIDIIIGIIAFILYHSII